MTDEKDPSLVLHVAATAPAKGSLLASTGLACFILWCTILSVDAEASFLPRNPPWPPTYNLQESLISMQANFSGYSSPQRAAEFGIISYDWSNAKELWAQGQPMNGQLMLLEQARLAKQAGTKQVFVYKNTVQALSWFHSDREKLLDPAYADFFVPFDRSQSTYHVPTCAPDNVTKCSELYHNQNGVPTPDLCRGKCNCGPNLPCGVYLYNFRNGTQLREWLVHDIVQTLEAGIIDGFFLDDYWCSDILCHQTDNNPLYGCPCHNPAQGPAEAEPHVQIDTGLSDWDIYEMTLEWRKTLCHLERAIWQHSAYAWSMMYQQDLANAEPLLLTRDACTQHLENACDEKAKTSFWQTSTVLFGLTVSNSTILSQLYQDVAFFLLARGDYAYLGWGVWGMTWPFGSMHDDKGNLLPDGVPLPSLLKHFDPGQPLDMCWQDDRGVFHRRYSNAHVTLDCKLFHANLDWENGNPIVAS